MLNQDINTVESLSRVKSKQPGEEPMMSDIYVPESTGFEGTASDHLKNEMQAIQSKLFKMVGHNLRSVTFWIAADSYANDELSGTFELSVKVDTEGQPVDYRHTGPSLDAALDHVLRHIEVDLGNPEIPSGGFHLPKLITAQ
jgi:hypothetical protein